MIKWQETICLSPAIAVVIRLDERGAKFPARCQSVLVRGFVADHAVAGKDSPVVAAAGFPAAHPFPVAQP